VHGLQGLCCGLAVAALALAAGIHGGARPENSGLLLVALLTGALVVGAWAWEHRRPAREVARRIDRALAQDGALFTAWEVEGRERPGRLDRRLGREVAARSSGRDMLRAVLPTSAPFLALPFAAAALLFGVLEEARHVPSAFDLEALTRQVQEGLASLSAAGDLEGSPILTHEQEQELRGLLGEMAELRRRLPREGLSRDELDGVGQRLAELAAELADSEPARREFDRALSSLDAARMALEGREGGGPRGAAGPAAGEGGAAGSVGRSLASGAGDGRMSAQEPPPAPSTSRPEAGVLGSRAWPRGYESLIRRWVESRRQAASDG
jgi:hypothetical protein